MTDQSRPASHPPIRALPRADSPSSADVPPSSSDPSDGVRGTVRIAPAVLIELIELSVRDIPGVVGFDARHRVERILPRAHHDRSITRAGNSELSKTYEEGGIRVHITGDHIDADVSIIVRQGANILELSRAIKRRVGVAVGRMLGMTVAEVNVYVADIERDARGED